MFKNIHVAAPGSSEETIASLKTMQQMQKSHTEIAKKKIVVMEKERKIIDERVKQLVRRLVEKDSKGVMTNFHEKVTNPPSDCANGAIYIFEDDFINWLDNNKYQTKDFSNDLLPRLLNKVQTYHTNKVYLDIGTKASLEEARNFFNE